MIIFNILYPKISGNEVSLSMSIKNLAERASEVDLLFHLMKLGSNPFSNSCVSFVAGCLYLTWTNGTTPNSCFIGIYHWYLTKLTCLGVMHTSYICFQCGVWRVCGRIMADQFTTCQHCCCFRTSLSVIELLVKTACRVPLHDKPLLHDEILFKKYGPRVCKWMASISQRHTTPDQRGVLLANAHDDWQKC